MNPTVERELTPAEIAAAKDEEYWRQRRVHAHRLATARRKRGRKVTQRSRRANRSAA